MVSPRVLVLVCSLVGSPALVLKNRSKVPAALKTCTQLLLTSLMYTLPALSTSTPRIRPN